MTLWTLAARSLRYYWRPQLAVLFAVVVATAALTGALLVGDSMRASLRRQAFDRIGRFSHVILAPRNVRQSFVTRLAHQQTLQSELITPCPILLSPCGVSEPNSHRRVDQAQVLGVTRDFWIQGENAKHKDFQEEIPPNHAVLTQTLADELGVGIGDDVVLRVGKPAEVSTDSILGRREERITQTRLTVKKVIPAKGVATFSLNLQHAPPKNIFVALETLQQTLGVKNRVNAVLLAPGVNARNRKGIPETLPSNSTRLEDVGLRLRVDEERRYVSLENESFLIPTDVAHAAQALAPSDDLEASPLIAYLANEITNITSLASSQPVRGVLPAIPYSTVAAINGAGVVLSQFEPAESKESLTLQTGQILLNGVAAERLSANVGDRIRLSYYTTGALGELDEQTAEFTVSGVVALAGAAADSGFVPEYPGITDAKSLMDWDPPFPVDLKKIMDADEAYWDEYRATPKAYVSLTDGERLWSSEATTLGTYTSIRFYPTNNEPISALADKFRETLNAELSPSDLGIEYRDLHAEFAAGAKGSTDFSGLFIGFSFFLIAAAAGLIALLFRLGIERRAGEVGLLSALGYSHKSVRNLLLSEGAIVAATGSVIGVVGAIFYAWLMLEGLRNWWSAAVNAPFLRLSISPMTLIIGLVSGILLALATIWWSLRDLAKHSPRALLSGNMSLKQVEQKTRFPVASTIFFGALVAGLGILATALFSDAMPKVGAFFGGGVLLLVALLTQFRISLRRKSASQSSDRSLFLLIRRSLARNPGRSMLTASLIASATFLLVSLEAFRLSPPNATEKDSGTGGCSLLAESSAPIFRDLNRPSGRGEFGISSATNANFADVQVLPFRLRPGDETSCLNLYVPRSPRVVGAPDSVIQRDGFRFQDALTTTENQKRNPWLLLNESLDDGAIPAIGDEAAVKWQLHSGLGKSLEITDDAGNPRTLRFVALLSGSVLQSEIVVSEDQFKNLFPAHEGYRFFLIDTGKNDPQAVSDELERAMAEYGLDVQSTTEKLTALFAVQNTYLSTFQTLGGFGLLLGTLGLAAVMLRNVYERRRELALLQAVGFDRAAIRKLVLGENAALVLAGLLLGAIPAVIAVAPALLQRPGSPQFVTSALTLLGVGAAGMLAGFVALRSVWRDSLVRALRSE